MSAATLPQPHKAIEHPLLVIERILRDRDGLWKQVLVEHRLNELIGQMIASSAVALSCYGLVLGFSNGPLQALSSAIKLPLLFLLTLLICLPTLYLFNLVFGARLSVRQAMALVLIAITVTSMLTLAFAPISLFFLVTVDYGFNKLLNVSILTLTGSVGLSFLLDGMGSLNKLTVASQRQTVRARMQAIEAEAQDASDEPEQPSLPPSEKAVSMSLLYIWVLLYGFVGTQLGWTLRPFFGSPNKPFELFRSLEGNFYVNIVQTIIKMLS
jgi:hypothetical protein